VSVLNDVVVALQFVNDSRVLDLTRSTNLTLAKTAYANKVTDFIALFIRNATDVLGSLTLPGPTEELTTRDRICILESHKNVAWTCCASG